MTAPDPHLTKRVLSGITVEIDDLRTILHRFAEVDADVRIRANAYNVTSAEEIEQVLAEDVVLDRLDIVARDGSGLVEVSLDAGCVEVRSEDAGPRLRIAGQAIRALLASKPQNGYGRCVVQASTPGSWTAPAPLELPAEPAPAKPRPGVAAPAAGAAVATVGGGRPPSEGRLRSGERPRGGTGAWRWLGRLWKRAAGR